MKRTYHIVNKDAEAASASIEAFTKANGQALLPLVELITQARVAVDEVIHTIGRQTIETVLLLSAREVAGERRPGKAGGDIPLARLAGRPGRFGRPPDQSAAAPPAA